MKKVFIRDKSFYRLLATLTVPIILKNLIVQSVSMADNVMVASLGDSAVNGATTANMLTSFLFIILMNISASVIVLSTQYWGKGDTKSIRTIVGIGLRFSMVISVAGFVLSYFFPRFTLSLFTNDAAAIEAGCSYLRIISWTYLVYGVTDILVASMTSVESVRIGMITSLSASLLNVLLNYLLIYGISVGSHLAFPRLGLDGAAVATLISRITELVTLCFYLLFVDKKLKLRPRDLVSGNLLLLKDFLKYGLPIIAGGMVWAINISVQGAILGKLGIPEAISASSVAGTLFNIITVVTFSVSSAAGIIIGKAIGSGDMNKVRQYVITLEFIFLGLGLFTGGMLLLSLMLIPMVYSGLSPSALAMSRQFVLVLSVTGIGTSYQACSLSLLKAGGDTRFVFLNDSFWVLVVVLPSAWIAGYLLHAPAWLVFALLKGDQIYKCFVALIKVNRFRWIRNITRDIDSPAEATEPDTL